MIHSRRRIRLLLPCAWCVVWSSSTLIAADDPPSPFQVIERANVTIRHAGLSTEYAKSIADIADTSYQFYKSTFGMNMPDRVSIEATLNRDNDLSLYAKSDDTLVLTYRRESDLESPRKSRIDSIYGISFAIARLAIDRTLGPAPWLSDTYARGLSHYLACDAIDRLYVLHGKKLWPEYDDYVETGWRELREDLKRRNAPPIIRASAEWVAYARDFGKSGIGELLRNWKKAKPPANRPENALLNAMTIGVNASHEQAKRKRWFREFSKKAVWSTGDRKRADARRNSGDLARSAQVIQYDDGTAESCTVVAKGSHVITFQSPDDQWYLTQVQFHGERYGRVPRSGMDFVIVIRDEKFQTIATITKPYGYLRDGAMGWHHIDVPVARLPARFVVSIEFASTDHVGFRMSADQSTTGHSGQGGLTSGIVPLEDRDWMIRVQVDRAKDDNPLTWRPRR